MVSTEDVPSQEQLEAEIATASFSPDSADIGGSDSTDGASQSVKTKPVVTDVCRRALIRLYLQYWVFFDTVMVMNKIQYFCFLWPLDYRIPFRN